MELKNQTVVVSNYSRPLANFHPNIWGSRFLSYIPESMAREEKLVEELKDEVKRELKEASNDYMRELQMVDAIQRLGIAYHFEEEIDEALQNLFEKYHDYCQDNHDLYNTALSFRILRQHGYRVSCEIFEKFKDVKGDFKVPDIEDVMGMLELFEATHLGVHDEEILDHGFVFTRNYLESVLPRLNNPIREQVHHALNEFSNRRGLPRLEARHYISIYDQLYASHNEALLTLAKLDFNLLQSLHKRELSQLCRWWQDLDVANKLSFARDRIVELYFWILGVYVEPEYAFARRILTQILAIMSLIDDTFDAYGTLEELEIFKEAIERFDDNALQNIRPMFSLQFEFRYNWICRWSMSCLDQLPNYMKIFYKALLEVFEEIEEEMTKQGRSYRVDYGKNTMKVVVGYFFAEAKWREERYKPRTEEYMQVATMSCCYPSLVTLSFIGMGDIATREAFDWVFSKPKIVKAASIICRLKDDIVGHEFERKREHIPSSVECYMEENKVSKQEAIVELRNRIEAAWKDMNEGFLKPIKFPTPLLDRILNLARVIEVIYSKGDWYTNVGPEMQSFIKQLLIDPVTD